MSTPPFQVRSRINEHGFLVTNRFLDQWSLDCNALAVWLMMRRFARMGETFVGLERIANMLHCSTKHVSRAIETLMDEGYIVRKDASGKGKSGPQGGRPFPVYVLLDPHEGLEDKSDDSGPNEGGLSDKLEDKLADKSAEVSGQKVVPILKNNNIRQQDEHSSLFAGGVKTIHTAVKDEIFAQFEKVNGVESPWSALAGTRLKKLLDSRPRWTLENWVVCIRNRYASDDKGALPSESPEVFIPYLGKYFSGPLNTFGNLKEKDNAPTVSARTQRNRDARDTVIREFGGASGLDYKPDLRDLRSDGE